MADKIFTFEELNKEMSKFSELGEVLDTSSVSTIDHYIHSGNYHLNACLTGSLLKGYPNNRAIALAGPKGCGKTFLLLNAAREAQKMGYYIIFYDSENAVDKEQAVKFGIDPTKFRYEPVGTVQEFRTQITQLTSLLIAQKKAKKEIPRVMIMLDSAGNLATQKEIDDALSGSEKADMTRAKVLKSIFRIIINKLALIKAPFMFTNHIYSSQSFIPQTIQGGGSGPEYAASITLFMTKAQLKEGDLKTGIIVSITPDKNRFAIPHKIKLHLSFTQGMNAYVGLEQYTDWDTCGIAPGTILDAVEIGKILKKIEKEKNEKKKEELLSVYNKVLETAYDLKGNGEESDFRCYLDPDQIKQLGVGGMSKAIAVKHLGTYIDQNKFFTPEVFTDEVIRMIDEKKITDIFEYKGADGSIEEINNFFDDNIEDLSEEEIIKKEPEF